MAKKQKLSSNNDFYAMLLHALSGNNASSAAPDPAAYSTKENPFLASLASGQIPTGIQSAFDDQMKRTNAQIIESAGTAGNRFGTGLTDTLATTDKEAYNKLLAGTETMGLGANAQENAINEAGMNRMFMDYLQSRGVPPQLAALLGVAQSGGTSSSGTAQQQPGGFDWGSLLGAGAGLASLFY